MEIWITDELLHETCNAQFMSPTQGMAKIISSTDIGEQKKNNLYWSYAQNTTFINNNTARKMQ